VLTQTISRRQREVHDSREPLCLLRTESPILFFRRPASRRRYDAGLPFRSGAKILAIHFPAPDNRDGFAYLRSSESRLALMAIWAGSNRQLAGRRNGK